MTIGKRLITGMVGSVLAVLIALSIEFFRIGEFNWWIIGVAAVLGFTIALFLKDDAVDFLKSMLWWA